VLRRHSTALRLSLMAADAASAILLFALVSLFRFGTGWREAWAPAGVDPAILAILYAIAWTTTLWLLGLYRLRARWSWRREWMDVLRGMLLLAVLSLAILFVARLPNVSRVFLAELFVAQALVTITSRLVVRRLYARVRARGYNASFILIVGDGPSAHEFAERLRAHAQFGVRVAGYLRDPAPGAPAPGLEVAPLSLAGVAVAPPGLAELALPDAREIAAGSMPRVLGEVEDLPAILHGMVVDEVAICLSPEAAAFVEPIARLCEDEGKVVRIPLGPVRIALAGGIEDNFDGTPILSLVRGPDRTVALMVKRALDIGGALAGLMILSPLLLGVACYIAARDGRPVIFRQVRTGRHGRPFGVFKYRTMVKDAEARYAEVAALSDTKGAAFKMTDDPRITRWGRVLRRSSIDELPQLINVLRGEMSLVGPRPAPPREVEAYDIWHRRRLSVKPGVTGLWQVEARRDEDFDRRAQLDLRYIDRWSLALDMKIILLTVPALFQGR
jgi:lipopolysaccharide/colanic/teichoic acid biosynthesis glycosyltransferase